MTPRSNEEFDAIQNVVDRVTSWQDGATESTIEDELRKGVAEVGVALDDADIATLASAIETEHGRVVASDVLG
ncbi:MAG TPA: hypothetical protein PLZ93_02600 [Nocardioides sp.]|uniref:hypothetical protein n=1 Tax=uncultured Nocardioides sp. TaxID=198441 RepID=UPI000ED7DB45|nr:hypothetical protein [uncultured Nocardioides sp.]HCB07358.1 hypothetical protein [Nocardioides sp.]HRD60221.1 hypothetical protein [Nocardioides sp.]HRI94486.1 hypothetical protein [Nocardioides sp.]HRK44424.1 hypothetical protein [Nocardioides sp.]